MCVGLLAGICQNKAPFGRHSLTEKRHSVRPNGNCFENNAGRVIGTFLSVLLCVHNKSVLHMGDEGLVLHWIIINGRALNNAELPKRRKSFKLLIHASFVYITTITEHSREAQRRPPEWILIISCALIQKCFWSVTQQCTHALVYYFLAKVSVLILDKISRVTRFFSKQFFLGWV